MKRRPMISIWFKDNFSILQMRRKWDTHGAKFWQERFTLYLNIEINFIKNGKDGHDVVIFKQFFKSVNNFAFTLFFVFSLLFKWYLFQLFIH